MMLANVPAVLLGDVSAKKLPLALVRTVAALSFVAMGVVTLFGVMPDSLIHAARQLEDLQGGRGDALSRYLCTTLPSKSAGS